VLDQLTVTPARLATAATHITDAAKAIDEILAQLDRDASALRASWSGEAQLAFDQAQSRFADAMETRSEAVGKICSVLKTLAEGYSTVDLESARALGAAS
jgi:WXG100 family type VII secretion target